MRGPRATLREGDETTDRVNHRRAGEVTERVSIVASHPPDPNQWPMIGLKADTAVVEQVALETMRPTTPQVIVEHVSAKANWNRRTP